MEECTDRVTSAEQRISNVEDSVIKMTPEVAALQKTVTELLGKVEDMECRNRRKQARLVNLPEHTEGQDATLFLEKLIPPVLKLDRGVRLVVERAHRVGTPPAAPEDKPRTLIMRFLNFKDREMVLKAAKTNPVVYNNNTLGVYPDLATSVHKRQRKFDPARKVLMEKGVKKHKILFPARLLVTHNDEPTIYETPAEVEAFIATL